MPDTSPYALQPQHVCPHPYLIFVWFCVQILLFWKFVCMQEEHPKWFLTMSSPYRGSSLCEHTVLVSATLCSHLCPQSSHHPPLSSNKWLVSLEQHWKNTSNKRSLSLEIEFWITSYSDHSLQLLMMCGTALRGGLLSGQYVTAQGIWK